LRHVVCGEREKCDLDIFERLQTAFGSAHGNSAFGRRDYCCGELSREVFVHTTYRTKIGKELGPRSKYGTGMVEEILVVGRDRDRDHGASGSEVGSFQKQSPKRKESCDHVSWWLSANRFHLCECSIARQIKCCVHEFQFSAGKVVIDRSPGRSGGIENFSE